MIQTMHRQVLVLTGAQALFVTASALVMTVGGLAGAQIAPTPQLATAPIAAGFLGTAVATVPASMWMSNVGREKGFIVGALLGTAGGLAAALGVWLGSIAWLSFGGFLIGTYQAFAQFYRFAASELATPDFRSRAISFVLSGGVIAALLGPWLGRVGGPLFTPEYLGSFLLLAAVSALAAALLLGFRMPKGPSEPIGVEGRSRTLFTIVRQPTYLVALFGAATGYGVMILAMTATPIAMLHHHHNLADATRVIQLHILGMFVPSFFTGSLISRFGVLIIMLTGVLLLISHVMLTLTSVGFYSFAGALIALGIGWNFLYVGGTTLLTSTYSAAEKGRAQAFNDMTIFVVSLAASLAVGALLEIIGWQSLNLFLLPWLALAGLVLLWKAFSLGRHRPQTATAR